MDDHEGLLAWSELAQAHTLVRNALSRHLEESTGLSLSEQELLFRLIDAPGQRLRMVDLATALLMQKSGITRLVDRVEQRGWVVREQPPDDRRTVYATLTTDGAAAFHRARPAFLQGLERHFGSRLDEEDVRQLRRLLSKLMSGQPAAAEDPALDGEVGEAVSPAR